MAFKHLDTVCIPGVALRLASLLACLAVVLFPSGCSTPPSAAVPSKPRTAPDTQTSITESAFEPLAYVRVSNTASNTPSLQTAARRFLPVKGRGPAVWLVGVSHVGEKDYYAALQKHLEKQALVLFEGINAGAHPGAPPSSTPESETRARSSTRGDVPQNAEATGASGSETAVSDRGSLQASMASALGLVFQLDAIDYTRPHFVNSDLSVDQIREVLARNSTAAQGKSAAGQGFETLMQMMHGDAWFSLLLHTGLRFVGSNPHLQGLARLTLIEALSEMEGDPSNWPGVPPEWHDLLTVLIRNRNDRVVTDLKEQLIRHPRGESIALFYGSGHMPDLERRLRAELGYTPRDTTWFAAFSVDMEKARISAPQRDFIRGLLRQGAAEGKSR